MILTDQSGNIPESKEKLKFSLFHGVDHIFAKKCFHTKFPGWEGLQTHTHAYTHTRARALARERERERRERVRNRYREQCKSQRSTHVKVLEKDTKTTKLESTALERAVENHP